jgi:soluble lytic murein transglycosylase-like protein
VESLISCCLCGYFIVAAMPGRASTGAQFVSARTHAHCDRSLSYAQVKADPAKYAGRVMELSGTVGGTIDGPDGVSVMLNLPDGAAPTLDFPASEASTLRDFATPTLRVLVQIGQDMGGNIVALRVLAVAHDSAVRSIEAQHTARRAAEEQAAAARLKEQERWHSEAERSMHHRTAASMPSRGSFERLAPGQAGDYTRGLSDRARPLFVPYYNFIAQSNGRLSRERAGLIAYHLLNFADHYNVDPRLVVSMIIAESNFNPDATSRTGAMGLGQLMPGTAKSLGVGNAYDPVQNLGGAISYLRSRLDTFSDKSMPGGSLSFEQVSLAMAAYNAGTGAVRKYHGIPPYRETQAYVRRVMSLYQQLCAADGRQ